MSIQQYEQARELIERAGGGDFEGPKPESLVAKAENVLGVVFPPSYRHFLLQMGCGDFNGLEIYGLIGDNFEESTVPNGIWLTLHQRRAINLPPSCIIIGDGGDGNFYAIDTNRVHADGESPVIRVSIDGKYRERVADSFGNYLLDSVRGVLN